MSDLLVFLKDFPTNAVKALDWPEDTKFVVLDPPASLKCGGDPLCSTAYTNTYNWLKDANGQVMPNLLAHYARGISVDRVAFVGFSAAHGLLDPLARNPADRDMISAYILLDATFGGGKTGYQAFLNEAADGDRLLVTTTSNSGGTEGWEKVVAATGIEPKLMDPRAPMPDPSGGAWRLGKLGFWYKFVDAKNKTELPHTSMHDILPEVLEAYLIPYWSGRLGFPWLLAGAGLAVAAGGAYAAYRILRP